LAEPPNPSRNIPPIDLSGVASPRSPNESYRTAASTPSPGDIFLDDTFEDQQNIIIETPPSSVRDYFEENPNILQQQPNRSEEYLQQIPSNDIMTQSTRNPISGSAVDYLQSFDYTSPRPELKFKPTNLRQIPTSTVDFPPTPSSTRDASMNTLLRESGYKSQRLAENNDRLDTLLNQGRNLTTR
jgi:hypothetical protein